MSSALHRQPASVNPPNRRALPLRRSTGLLVLTVLLAFAVLIAAMLASSYESAIDNAEAGVEERSTIYYENTRLVFASLDAVTEATAEEMRAGRPEAAALHRYLRGVTQELTMLRVLLVLDEDGTVLGDSRPDQASLGTSVADRDYFRVHLQGSEENFYISRAVQSRVDGAWSIPVSRPVYDERGRLLAVVVASITPEYFNQLFAGVTPNDRTMGILAGDDGHVLSVFPYDPRLVDKSMENSELFLDCLPACEQGLFHGRELLHGNNEHIIAYRLIEPYGLVVSFSVDKDEVLAGFYEDVAQGVALFLAVAVVVLLAAGYQARQARALTHQSERLEGITVRLQETLAKHEVAENSLREREELYRKLFYHAPIGIFTKDLEGRYTSSNDDMNQFAEGSVIGKTEADLQPPDIAAEVRAHDQEVIQKGKHIVFEERYQTPRGLRYLLSSKVPLRDADANIIGILGTTLDVTERRENAALREALIADLEARNAEMERFTYTVSHDLRSPLVTVEGFLGMLEKDALAGDVEKVREDIAYIRSATRKMGELLRELLELSRVGRLTNEPVQISMRELAEEAVALLAGQIGEKRISVDIAPDLPAVLGDRVRLVEVLQNLLSNAIKYTRPGVPAHIQIGYQPQKGETVFFVRDNGIGIAPEFQEKVFELFAKLNPNSEGTGIGLALVRRIVEVHGGRIWVESAGVGQGTTFYFTLSGNGPAAGPHAAVAANAGPEAAAKQAALEKGGEP